MTVEIAATRVAVDFVWDTTVVTGSEATLLLNGVEVSVVRNDGEVATVFPIDFNGAVEVTIRGSESGEETNVLEVVSPLFDPAPADGTDDTGDVEVTTPPAPDTGEVPTDVPAPAEPEGSDLPVDSESEIPDDASSEQGEVPPAEPVDPEQVPVDPATGEPTDGVDAPVDPTSEPLPVDPVFPVDEPAEDVGTTPQEGGETGASTVS